MNASLGQISNTHGPDGFWPRSLVFCIYTLGGGGGRDVIQPDALDSYLCNGIQYGCEITYYDQNMGL